MRSVKSVEGHRNINRIIEQSSFRGGGQRIRQFTDGQASQSCGQFGTMQLKLQLIRANGSSLVLIALASLLISIPAVQSSSSSSSSHCLNIRRCNTCIRTANCVWCKNPKFTEVNNPHSNYSRCNTVRGHKSLGICQDHFLVDPQSRLQIKETVTEPLEGMIQQLKPHAASLRLRVGNKVNITLQYFDTENKPLDLYYVMDLSATMDDDKPKVAQLGTTLAKRIRSLTSNVQIGFGSFIDKPIIPFVSVAQQTKADTENSTAPYGFRNHLSLTGNIDRFQQEVKKAKISGNLDAPEGGLDAIMQAAACGDLIGWRDSARHLLILSTDGPFHIAGDARLGGILKPNDMKCHMDPATNLYTHSTLMDYPSIAQVNTKMQEENVFVIFAVTKENVPLYEMLAAHIQGSTAQVLEEDSKNVVELVEQEYKKIISSLELPKQAGNSNFVRLTYFAKCTNASPIVRTNKCQNLKVGSNATFVIQVELVKCPTNPKDWEQTFIISPIGVSEKLTLSLSFMCDCPCEKEIDEGYVENDPQLCEEKGTPRCGICDCGKGYRGRNCQCSMSESEGDSSDIDDSACQQPGSPLICSGRGACICGQCECNKAEDGRDIYSGSFCECDDVNCPYGDNGLLCSGHGECKCGRCTCDPFYKGESCSCFTRTLECKEMGDDIPCNGRGKCSCGKCVCDHPYTGKFCHNCPNCPGKCADPSVTDCIQCFVTNMNLEENRRRQCIECENLYSIEAEDEVFEESDDEKLCVYLDDLSGCESRFVYGYITTGKTRMYVRVERTQKCFTEIPIAWIVLSVVGAIVVLGLMVLLCWKCVMYMHDASEVKKFEKEQAMATWTHADNPIYKQATSTYRNPAYKRKSTTSSST